MKTKNHRHIFYLPHKYSRLFLEEGPSEDGAEDGASGAPKSTGFCSWPQDCMLAIPVCLRAKEEPQRREELPRRGLRARSAFDNERSGRDDPREACTRCTSCWFFSHGDS